MLRYLLRLGRRRVGGYRGIGGHGRHDADAVQTFLGHRLIQHKITIASKQRLTMRSMIHIFLFSQLSALWNLLTLERKASDLPGRIYAL